MMIIEAIKQVVDAERVLQGDALAERYEHIWSMDTPLRAFAMVLPNTTKELSEIMALCHQHNQAVVIHGGLTNLTGATVTSPEEIAISLERMNKIIEIDSQSRTMTVEAGVILEQIHVAAENENLLFPLSFGAKGSAQIGGIIATNAGGLRVLRYGMTRNLILGLEVVMADGTIINSLKKIIKDNSGYDLKNIFIGAEGTLGVVTKAVLKLSEAPVSRVSAFVGLYEYTSVVRLLKFMDKGLAGTLTGFELIWQDCYIAMTSPPAMMKPPLAIDYPFYVLIDCLGSDQDGDVQRMETLLEEAMENDWIADAALATNQADLHWFWTIREDVGIFVSQHTYSQHFDISLPLPHIGNVLATITERLLGHDDIDKVYVFGHVADGNIHVIAGKRKNNPELTSWINDVVYSPLADIGGSISAEHGIGLHKKKYLPISRTKEEINLMRQIKGLLDPKNILNRDKIF